MASWDGERAVGEGLESGDGDIRDGAISSYVGRVGIRSMGENVQMLVPVLDASGPLYQHVIHVI